MIEKEIWKDIKGYEGLYKVSNLGRIKNIIKGNVLKGCFDKDGYLITQLTLHNKKKTVKFHRIVAETFIKNSNNYKTINHIDENKTNNNINNLEWCTQAYNNSYSKSKNIIQLTLDGQVIKKWKNASQVEKELGIFSTNIRSCCRGVIKTCGGYIWKYE